MRWTVVLFDFMRTKKCKKVVNIQASRYLIQETRYMMWHQLTLCFHPLIELCYLIVWRRYIVRFTATAFCMWILIILVSFNQSFLTIEIHQQSSRKLGYGWRNIARKTHVVLSLNLFIFDKVIFTVAGAVTFLIVSFLLTTSRFPHHMVLSASSSLLGILVEERKSNEHE